MTISFDKNTVASAVKLRYASHSAWTRTSIVGSFFAVVVFWALTLAMLLGFISISQGLTANIIHVTMVVATIVLTVVAVMFGIKIFREEEKDILEITDNDITFKIVKSNCRKLSSVSIPFREIDFVEHITPSAEESPLGRSSLILHDTNEQRVTVPIWTMTNNVLPILDFLKARKVRVIALNDVFHQLSG